MARKVDAARHDEVVAQAFAALQRRGVVGVSMADLAADLGMSRSSLYWYVDGLPDLFEQALAQLLEGQALAIAQALDGVDDPLDAIAAWMRAMVAYHHGRPERLAALVQLWAVARPGSKDETLRTFAAVFEPMRAAFCALLRQGVADGRVRPCDPAALFDLCAVVVDGALVHGVSRNLDAVQLVEDFLRRVVLPLRAGSHGSSTSDGLPVSIPRRHVESAMDWD